MTAAAQPLAANGEAAARSFQQMIEELMAQARADDQMDRRGAARYPYFRPATIQSDRVELGPHLAFTRELSINGVGLLHNVLLEPGRYLITISPAHGPSCSIATEILWQRPCGEGWYVSGGRFVPPA